MGIFPLYADFSVPVSQFSVSLSNIVSCSLKAFYIKATMHRLDH